MEQLTSKEEKKLWTIFFKVGPVLQVQVKHTEREMSSIHSGDRVKLTSPHGKTVFINEENVALIVEGDA